MSTSTMKDYVLGSDEFLINFYDLLERRLATCIPLPTDTSTEESLPEEEPTRSPVTDNSPATSSFTDFDLEG
jgi:hypothetical protein